MHWAVGFVHWAVGFVHWAVGFVHWAVGFVRWAVDPADVTHLFPRGPPGRVRRAHLRRPRPVPHGRGGVRARPGPGVRAESRIGLRPAGPAPDGPLEHFLTARWGLHTAHVGRTRYVPNTPRVALRSAELTELDGGLVASVGPGHLVAGAPDHVAFSDGVPVSFALRRQLGPDQLDSVSSKE